MPGKKIEIPIFELNRYGGISAKYQEVVSWEVDRARTGKLIEVAFVCDIYTTLYVRIDIAGKELINKQIQAPLNIPYYDLELVGGSKVVVSCRSDGAQAIVFDASILGKEIQEV